MVALVLSLIAAFALGLTSWVPRVLARDIGVAPVEPQLLVVAPDVRGAVTLGEGYTVALQESGFRIAGPDGTMADTVTRGAPISALRGRLTRVDGHPREEIAKAAHRVEIDRLELRGQSGRYTGTVRGDGLALPLVIDARRVGTSVQLLVRVVGADALVLHLHKVPAVVGIPPALPARNLRLKAWWIEPNTGAQSLFTWVTGTTVGVGPETAERAVDVRPDGLVNVHVWADTLSLTVSGTPRKR